MKTRNKKYLNLKFLLLVICFPVIVVAQKSEGNLGAEQVNVVQGYSPTVAEAVKINDNPVVKDTVAPAPRIKYSFLQTKMETNFIPDTIKPAKMRGEPLAKLYPGLLKVGLGNYSTPFGELYLGSLRSKTYQVGVHVKHFSSNYTAKNRGDAGFSDNLAVANGKYFVKEHILAAEIGYNRNANRFYGYTNRLFENYFDTLNNKQFYQSFNTTASVESRFADTNLLRHKEKIHYRYTNDRWSSRENNFLVSTELSKRYGNEIYGGALEWNHFNYLISPEVISGLTPIKADILKLNPFVKVRNKRWNAVLGINMFYEVQDQFIHFFPNVLVNAVLWENVASAYLSVNGATTRNSFYSVSQINPFIITPLNTFNTNTPIDALLGVKGKISKELSYNFSGNYKLIQNMPLFVNQINYFANYNQEDAPGNIPHDFRYILIDDDCNYFNVSGFLSYELNSKIVVDLKGNYYNYKMATEQKAWFKPLYDISLAANYRLEEKFNFKLNVFYIGQQFGKRVYPNSNFTGLIPDNFDAYKIKSWVDLNLGANYQYNKRLGAFVSVNNILGTRYQRWLDYPTQSFNFLIGATLSF
jgi:hypothetical protein